MLTKAKAGAGPNAALMTESNAEPFMAGVDVFLTLVGFEKDTSLSSNESIVPAFPAVYGGYVYAAGAEFFRSDLDDDGDVVSSGGSRHRWPTDRYRTHSFARGWPLSCCSERSWAG